MKRSEMLHRLWDSLIHNGLANSTLPDSPEINRVLRDLEDAGMQPPSYYKTIPLDDFPDDDCLSITYSQTTGIQEVQYRNWEDEL